ncbi:hypothetical protein JXQ70_12225 [bacterium]|nr:hypothetical protein [bacterium]
MLQSPSDQDRRGTRTTDRRLCQRYFQKRYPGWFYDCLPSTDKFEVEYEKTLPFVRGNYQQLEQVVINLVQNACQALAGPPAGIRIMTRTNKNAGTIELEIGDEGCGIDEV